MIFNLDSYKDYLIHYYRYEYDNNKLKLKEREEYINSHYSDEFLQEIIHNTSEFLLSYLENMINNNSTYFSINLISDEIYIGSNIVGGHHADTLLPIDDNIEEKYISLYLLKIFLGDSFKIYVDYEEIEYLDEINDDIMIGNVYYLPKLIISSTKEEIKKKYETTKLEKEKQLVRILKKRVNKE